MPPQPEPQHHPCEFTTPCTTTSQTPRKLISHIFGRNKTSTRTFPPHVWVYFCRKHYQRARYRGSRSRSTRSWAGMQCDVLMETLGRIERWGGVRCWRVWVRRRAREGCSGDGDGDMADVDMGVGDTAEPESESTCKPTTTDNYMYHNESRMTMTNQPAENGTKPASPKPAKTSRTHRKQPTPATIPTWLLQEVGREKSFADIRTIVVRIKTDIDRGALARFPDVEILPVFWD